MKKIRKAFVMSVNPGQEKEYEKRHRTIWPELEAVLKQHGVHNYSIFLHVETRQLFAYAEIEDEARWQAIAKTPACQKWWRHMADIMPANPDHSPVAVPLGKCSTSDKRGYLRKPSARPPSTWMTWPVVRGKRLALTKRKTASA
jgi:L-rhamnose mutarotase